MWTEEGKVPEIYLNNPSVSLSLYLHWPACHIYNHTNIQNPIEAILETFTSIGVVRFKSKRGENKMARSSMVSPLTDTRKHLNTVWVIQGYKVSGICLYLRKYEASLIKYQTKPTIIKYSKYIAIIAHAVQAQLLMSENGCHCIVETVVQYL